MRPVIRTSMTLLVSKILMDLTDLMVKPSVDFRLCISKASLHVFLLQPSMFTVLHLVNEIVFFFFCSL